MFINVLYLNNGCYESMVFHLLQLVLEVFQFLFVEHE